MWRARLQTLLEYDLWSVERLLDSAAGLSDEHLMAPAGEGHAPLHRTLTHMLIARMWWRLTWQGAPDAWDRVTRAEEEALRGWDGLLSLFDSEREATTTALDGLNDAHLDRSVDVVFPRRTIVMTPYQMVMQAFQHDIRHGAEVAQALTLLGHSPGDMDLDDFVNPRDR